MISRSQRFARRERQMLDAMAELVAGEDKAPVAIAAAAAGGAADHPADRQREQQDRRQGSVEGAEQHREVVRVLVVIVVDPLPDLGGPRALVEQAVVQDPAVQGVLDEGIEQATTTTASSGWRQAVPSPRRSRRPPRPAAGRPGSNGGRSTRPRGHPGVILSRKYLRPCHGLNLASMPKFPGEGVQTDHQLGWPRRWPTLPQGRMVRHGSRPGIAFGGDSPAVAVPQRPGRHEPARP